MSWLVIKSDTSVTADNNGVPAMSQRWALDPVVAPTVKQWKVKSVAS